MVALPIEASKRKEQFAFIFSRSDTLRRRGAAPNTSEGRHNRAHGLLVGGSGQHSWPVRGRRWASAGPFRRAAITDTMDGSRGRGTWRRGPS